MDGRLHVKMIQSSSDLPPPENDQVADGQPFNLMSKFQITLVTHSCQGVAVDQPELERHGILQLHREKSVWRWCTVGMGRGLYSYLVLDIGHWYSYLYLTFVFIFVS